MKATDSIFQNERIQLDGAVYLRCRFEGCTLVYSGGALPVLHGCHFDPVELAFEGAAANTLTLIASMYHGGFKPFIEKTFDNIRNSKPSGIGAIH